MEYLYIYRESNTVIQLYRESENTFTLSDGEWIDKLNLSDERNKYVLENLKEGIKCTWAVFESGDEWQVYATPAAAFGV